MLDRLLADVDGGEEEINGLGEMGENVESSASAGRAGVDQLVPFSREDATGGTVPVRSAQASQGVAAPQTEPVGRRFAFRATRHAEVSCKNHSDSVEDDDVSEPGSGQAFESLAFDPEIRSDCDLCDGQEERERRDGSSVLRKRASLSGRVGADLLRKCPRPVPRKYRWNARDLRRGDRKQDRVPVMMSSSLGGPCNGTIVRTSCRDTWNQVGGTGIAGGCEREGRLHIRSRRVVLIRCRMRKEHAEITGVYARVGTRRGGCRRR